MIEVGLKNTEEVVVDSTMTAKMAGSGGLDVFSTPHMIAFMEGVSKNLIDRYLEEGQSSVGTHIDVKHLAATPVGMKVSCESEIIEVDRKRIVFKLVAKDEFDVIGTGTHERFIISIDKFLKATNDKLEKMK